MGWKLTLDWDMAGRSILLYRRGTATDFVGSTDCGGHMAEIVGNRHGPDTGMRPSSCRRLPWPWRYQRRSQRQALGRLCAKWFCLREQICWALLLCLCVVEVLMREKAIAMGDVERVRGESGSGVVTI
jgi:hypothetical protein